MGEIPRRLRDEATSPRGPRSDAVIPQAHGVTIEPINYTIHSNNNKRRGERDFCVQVENQQHQVLALNQEGVEGLREMRVKVLDAIVTCLQAKRPGWQKARILHLSSQLEESMYSTKKSLVEHGDPSTLLKRINEHCRLLATRKTTTYSQPNGNNNNSNSNNSNNNVVPINTAMAIVNSDSSFRPPTPPPSFTAIIPTSRAPLPAVSATMNGSPSEAAEALQQRGSRGGRGGSGSCSIVPHVRWGGRQQQRSFSTVRGQVDGGVLQHGVGEAGGRGSAEMLVPGNVQHPEPYSHENARVAMSPPQRVSKHPNHRHHHQQQQHHSSYQHVEAEALVSSSSCSSPHHHHLPQSQVSLQHSFSDRALKDNQDHVRAINNVGAAGAMNDNSSDATAAAVMAAGLARRAGNDGGNGGGGGFLNKELPRVAGTSMKGFGGDLGLGSQAGGMISNDLDAAGTDAAAALRMLDGSGRVAVSGGGGAGVGLRSSEGIAMHAPVHAAVHAVVDNGGGGDVGGGVGGADAKWAVRTGNDCEKKFDAAEQEEVKQHALRLLQCRVLLLTHASSCSEEEGSCRLAPLCDSVRQLLSHMQACEKGGGCEFPHCASSKAVLQHQHFCDDFACELCGSVRDLSRKCYWANARHAHKRRLEESHELRRKKRQSEGKAVAPPRKYQADRAKSGRENCSGLDEAGNDLGDISPGFFLRQAKAVKARNRSQQEGMARSQQQTSLVNDNNDVKNPATGNHFKNDNGNDDGGLLADNKAPPSPSPSSHFQQHPPEKRQELGDATAAANSTDSHIFSGSGGGGGAASTDTATATPLSNGLLAIGETKKPGTSEIREREQSATPDASAAAATTTSAAAAAAATANGCTAPVRQPSFHPAQPEDEEEERERGDSGGGAEAHAVVGCSGGGGRGRVAARGGGELTVAIPPAAAGAAAGIAGHLRSHSMTMLDEIAESLADTSRKPSFARMQSVQAFLDGNGDLRESASFGDASVLVGQWMNNEDGAYDDDQMGLSSAFSF